MAKEMNSDGQAGSSRIDQSPEVSGNAKLGIDSRYAGGTVGSREGAFYGGERNTGVDYPRAVSASKPAHDKNAGNPDFKDSSNSTVGITDKMGAVGTVSSDETNTKKGQIMGKGAGSNPAVNAENVLLGGVKTFNRDAVMSGTGAESKSYKRSLRGYNNGQKGA